MVTSPEYQCAIAPARAPTVLVCWSRPLISHRRGASYARGYIIDKSGTPVARRNGAFPRVHPRSRRMRSGLRQRSGVDPLAIDDVRFGVSTSAAAANRRTACLAGDCPKRSPASHRRQCVSAQQASRSGQSVRPAQRVVVAGVCKQIRCSDRLKNALPPPSPRLTAPNGSTGWVERYGTQSCRSSAGPRDRRELRLPRRDGAIAVVAPAGPQGTRLGTNSTTRRAAQRVDRARSA